MEGTTGHALHARFQRGLSRSPQGIAVTADGRSVTYTELHRLALDWAGPLARDGHRTVGVLAAKTVTAYAGILAALYAGAAVVPLRPDFPAVRTRAMLHASGTTALLVDARGEAAATALTDGDDRLPVRVYTPERTPADPAGALAEPRPVRPGDPAYLLFTSGSTGRPKGVVITHAATAHYFGLLDERYDFTPRDVFSQTFDLNFDCSLFDIFCAWGAGARLLAIPAQAYRDLPRYLHDQGVTVWFSTPSAIRLARRMGALGKGALPGLRWSFFAGEALTCRDAADWREAAPGATLENLYGPTEATITLSAYRWSDTGTPPLAANGTVPIGTIHAGHDVLLLDDGQAAADEGELCVSGPQLTPGYLDPADDGGRFFDRAGRRWYRTGDRVRRLPDGAGLLYLGRLDSQLQVQGWRVEPAEIEHALRACPGIQEAVVVGVPGDTGTELFVFYTGIPQPLVEIARPLRRLLPEGVVPRHYRHLDDLPLNSNRKVDRGALTAHAAELLNRR